MTQKTLVSRAGITTEVLHEGAGPVVMMVASLGRPAEDFDDLAQHVVRAGFRAVRPQPRGIGQSSSALPGVSLDDMSDDLMAVIDWAGGSPVVLIGHAFGNRLSRNTARRHGAKIDSLVLLACGGQIKSPASAHADLLACFDDTLPADAHLETVRRAFFAPGNDPAVWRDGWYKDTAMMQGIAVRNSDHAYWKLAGGKPFLIVQALQDAIAPPPNAHALLEAAPDQVRMIELDGAGHAMLPEKPDEIARIVLERLNERRAAGWR